MKSSTKSDFLANEIRKRACAVLLFGSSSNTLREIIIKAGFSGQIKCFKGLNKATERALELAIKEKAQSILFSPACASFDQYQNYEERGEHFRKMISPFIFPK